MNLNLRLANVRTLELGRGEQAIYIGRGPAPIGMEHARLGNPYRVGAGFARGQAAAAYLPYLRERCRTPTPERSTILRLAGRLTAGEALVLVCWCAPEPCHGVHIQRAILGYAQRLGEAGTGISAHRRGGQGAPEEH